MHLAHFKGTIAESAAAPQISAGSAKIFWALSLCTPSSTTSPACKSLAFTGEVKQLLLSHKSGKAAPLPANSHEALLRHQPCFFELQAAPWIRDAASKVHRCAMACLSLTSRMLSCVTACWLDSSEPAAEHLAIELSCSRCSRKRLCCMIS